MSKNNPEMAARRMVNSFNKVEGVSEEKYQETCKVIEEVYGSGARGVFSRLVIVEKERFRLRPGLVPEDVWAAFLMVRNTKEKQFGG